MSTPRFSLLIPTRNRLPTLRYALETALAQTHDDYEVVVMDNNCTDGTTEYVESLDNPRLRHMRSDSALSMSTNWELGLSHCRGQYVSIIGDDDGFMPEAVAYADSAIRNTGAEVLSWEPHNYWWPDTIVPYQRNMLYVNLNITNDASRVNSIKRLEAYYRYEVSYSALPQIYNAFVSRKVIDRAIAKTGRYFQTESPDVYSGIANCWLTDNFVAIERPLCVRGISGRSHGTAYFMRSKGADIRDKHLAEVGLTLEGVTHPTFGATLNLEFGVASINLLAKEILFPGDVRFPMDEELIARHALANAGRDPDSYDEVVAEVRDFCVRRGLDPKKYTPPVKPPMPTNAPWGPLRDNNGNIVLLAVHGDVVGLATIADAVRFCSAVTASPR